MASESISSSELAVLEVLWEHERSTVREITQFVYGRHTHSLHAGVKSFLERLIEKELVDVDKDGFSHCFFARVSRSEFVGRELQSMADSYFRGSLRPLMLSLVDNTRMSRKDRESIEALIERMKD